MCKLSCSVVTLWTVAHLLLCLWDFSGKNTGGGCHFPPPGIFLTQEVNPRLPRLLHWGRILYLLSHQGGLLRNRINNSTYFFVGLLWKLNKLTHANMPGTQEALGDASNSNYNNIITLIPRTSLLITMASSHFTPLVFASLLLVTGVRALGKPSFCCAIYTDLKYACKLDPITHFFKSLWTQRAGLFFNFFKLKYSWFTMLC